MEKSRFAKDFIFEVMKDSQRLRAGFLAEREKWLRTLAVDGREEVLFEFEMLLRGLERYFNLHNLPIVDGRAVIARDFSGELRVVRDALSRAIALTKLLLDPPTDRSFVFRRFVEARLADDRARGKLLEESLEQGTPQESLFLLRQGFGSLRGVADAVGKLPYVSFQLFSDLGQLTVREIALSKYFRPFRALEFRIEYDRIKSVRILDVLRRIPEERGRRIVSLAFLGLFRLLHYLRYVTSPDQKEVGRRAHLVLALVKSEATSLAGFLDHELPGRIPDADPLAVAARRSAADLHHEVGKIVKHDLAAAGPGDADAVARAREALGTLFKQNVARLARAFDPALAGAELFDDYVSRREQALRLRLDLHAFAELCRRASARLQLPGVEGEAAVVALRGYMAYFRDVSYQLLRYGDYEPFDRFVDILEEMEGPAPYLSRAALADGCRTLEGVLARTADLVSNREELRDAPPLEPAEASSLADRYLAAPARSAEASGQ